MRIFPVVFLTFSVSLLWTGCERGSGGGSVPEEKPAAESKPPALSESAIESLILDALTPAGEESARAGDTKRPLAELSDAQRKTLTEAVTKAISKIDFKALLTSIAGNHSSKGVDFSGFPEDMKVSTRVLSPEEAREYGIQIQTDRSENPLGDSTSAPVIMGDVRIVTIGRSENMPLLPTEPESGKSGNGTEAGIQEVSALEIANDSDPERAGRFRSLLESGDVDALAGEIADLIQTGIDAATLQQAMSE